MDGHPHRPAAASLRRVAVELVADAGWQGLTDASLATRAGVSLDDLHDAYPSATECLLAAYDELCGELHDEMKHAFRSRRGWEDGLDEVMSMLVHWCAARPAATWLMFYGILRGDHRMREHREEARQRFVDLLVAEYRDRSDYDRHPDTQMEVLFGAVQQTISGWVEAGRTRHLPRLLPELSALAAVFEPVAA